MLQIGERQMESIARNYYREWRAWKDAKNCVKRCSGEDDVAALHYATGLRIYAAKLEAMASIIEDMRCVVKWDYEADKPVLVDISAYDEECSNMYHEFCKKGLCYKEEEDQ